MSGNGKEERIAHRIVSMAKFTDGLGEDSDGTNAQYDAQYERIVKSLYPQNVSSTIIMCGRGLDRQFGTRGTMGNGNIVLKYNADTRSKRLIIQAFVSERHKITREDYADIVNLCKFLRDQVEAGYTICTDCNTHSLPFLASFAKKYNYYFHAGNARMEFGDTGDEGDLSRMCICCKTKPDFAPEGNVDEFATRSRSRLDRMIDEGN